MSPSIKLRHVPDDDVPPESDICHYDELEEEAKERFPIIAGDRVQTTVDQSVAGGFSDCDLVKYTDYYEISLE